MRTVDSAGRLPKPLEGVPKVLAHAQGGLLDVAVDPRFAENRLVYVCYSEPDGHGAAGTSVVRGRLGEARLEDVQVIYASNLKSQVRITSVRAWFLLTMEVFCNSRRSFCLPGAGTGSIFGHRQNHAYQFGWFGAQRQSIPSGFATCGREPMGLFISSPTAGMVNC
jgi:hypothetical protein